MRAPARHRWGGTMAVVLVLGGGVGEVSGQDVRSAVDAAPDGYVRFTYAARPGVCGESRAGRCEEGPVRIELRVRRGVVRDLDVEVGGSWPTRSRDITDLGEIDPADAAEFLLRLAETSMTEAGEHAIFPTTIARGVEAWPRLLEIARGEARTDVRKQAVFWLGQRSDDPRVLDFLEELLSGG